MIRLTLLWLAESALLKENNATLSKTWRSIIQTIVTRNNFSDIAIVFRITCLTLFTLFILFTVASRGTPAVQQLAKSFSNSFAEIYQPINDQLLCYVIHTGPSCPFKKDPILRIQAFRVEPAKMTDAFKFKFVFLKAPHQCISESSCLIGSSKILASFKICCKRHWKCIVQNWLRIGCNILRIEQIFESDDSDTESWRPR